MGHGADIRRWKRRLGALLALLALAVGAIAPPGFMVANGRGGPAIVICTGHGPASLPGQTDRSNHRAGHDGACAFAGHGVTSTPPVVAQIAAAPFAPPLDARSTFADLAPGRGLAAPPPPSQGPPELS